MAIVFTPMEVRTGGLISGGALCFRVSVYCEAKQLQSSEVSSGDCEMNCSTGVKRIIVRKHTIAHAIALKVILLPFLIPILLSPFVIVRARACVHMCVHACVCACACIGVNVHVYEILYRHTCSLALIS